MCFKRIFQSGVWVLCLLVAFSVHGGVRDKGYILVINSYTEGAIWSNYVIDSIQKDQSIGENVVVESMNTLLIDDEESMRVKKDDVLSKHTERPKAIVLLGSSAWCLFEQELKGIWKDVPMILCVEDDYVAPVEAFLKKHEVVLEEKIPLLEVLGDVNVTIIKCPVYIRETIEEMRLLLPRLEKIVLISDLRYVSAQVRYQMREVCEQYFSDLEVAYFTEGEYTLDQVLDSIASFDIQKVGLLYYSWFQRKDLAGNKYLTSNNHKTICSYDNHPIFTLEDIGMTDGEMAGGYFYQGKDFAHTVMCTLREVLNGKNPKAIPVQMAGEPEYYLSYPILQKAGIPESLYPDNANYLFAPESFWEKTRYMWGVIAVLLFITYIMWVRVRLLKKEK